MIIRRAEPADLVEVAVIAEGSWRAAYAGLLKGRTVSAWIEAAYSPAALRQRWEDHPIYLVLEEGQIIAFADAFIEDDQIVISALCTHRAYRRRGAAGMLFEWIRSLAPPLPIIADVVLGSDAAESFFEAKGFVPGETIQVTLFGERIVERRWWLGAGLHPVTGERRPAAGFLG
ncbi:MAG TPA: GNAT family N-acetyltransferase [Acidimicrobiia bacterium]|nr:GNAT family N-acetyltransferase [Acidimicrobiia bacterium]